MKKIILPVSLVLGALIVVLVYWLYTGLNTPVEFKRERLKRDAVVIQRLKDIRTAQRSYRSKYNKFAPNFDELNRFLMKDSLEMWISIGSEDDSVAVAQGKVKRQKFMVAVKDTLFEAGYDYSRLRYIPFSKDATGTRTQFFMDTASIVTESGVRVPVFTAFAPYTSFLSDLNHQELINYVDERVKTLKRDNGWKVGDLKAATNEAGNWE